MNANSAHSSRKILSINGKKHRADSKPQKESWSHQICLSAMKGKDIEICADGLYLEHNEVFEMRNADQYAICIDKVRVENYPDGQKRVAVHKGIIVFKSCIQNISVRGA